MIRNKLEFVRYERINSEEIKSKKMEEEFLIEFAMK